MENIFKPDAFGSYPVDIRSEGGIAFAPPTEYADYVAQGLFRLLQSSLLCLVISMLVARCNQFQNG